MPPAHLAPIAERAHAPAAPPIPTAGGLTWRPATKADSPALLALMNAIEVADHTPYRTALAEIEDDFEASWRDFSRNSLLGLDESGTARAWAMVDLPAGDITVARVFVNGGVHPDRRGEGIGRQVMAWSLARARGLLAESGKELPARIAVYAEDDAPASAHNLYLRAGLHPVRYFSDLRRDLSLPLPDTTVDGSLRVVPWSPELDEATRLAHNDAFRDHWGSEPRDREMWTRGRTMFAPSWSFVVVDDAPDVDALLADPDTDPETAAALRAGEPLVVGHHMAERFEDDWPVRGFTFGYTFLLGARRAYRGRHIAVALLGRAMRAFADDGMQYAVLGVDTANPSGAHGLYASLGYEKEHGTTAYAIEL